MEETMVTDKRVKAAWDAWNKGSHASDKAAMLAAIEAADAAAWSDDMTKAPTDGTPVLVAWKGENFHPMPMHYEDGMFGWLNENFDFVCRPNKQPNIFRPLPEPPQ